MRLIISFILLGSFGFSYGQFSSRNVIDDELLTARYIQSGDLNGDQYDDIIVSYSNHFVWFENLAGTGEFSPEKIINTGLGQSFSNAAADLDGDGDLDLLFTSFDDGIVSWYENIDGEGGFLTANLISTALVGPDDISAFDLDGDGDLDILVTSDINDKILWYENLDGEGDFGEGQLINQGQNNGRFSRAGDLDGDGDLDVVTTNSGNTTLNWFENLDGLGNFSLPNVIHGTDQSTHSFDLADLDSDGDLDVAAVTNGRDRAQWFENLDGLGSFSTINIITEDALGARNMRTADFDLDGDLDLLYSEGIGDRFIWHENLDGLGSFGLKKIIDEGGMFYRQAIPVDLDNDGDEDVVGIIQNEGLLVYYENLTLLNSTSFLRENIIITPNPAQNNISITTGEFQLKKVVIRDIGGKQLLALNTGYTDINLNNLPSGMYFITLFSDDSNITKKIVKK